MRIVAILSVLGLAACGGADPEAACEDYVAAANSCAEESFAALEIEVTDELLLDAATICAGYADLSGDLAADSADLFDCYTATMDGADCSDAEAMADVDVTVECG